MLNSNIVTNNAPSAGTTAASPIEQMILEQGCLHNRMLWRESMAAQMLRYYAHSCSDTWFFDHFDKEMPYRYEWETTLTEIKIIAHHRISESDEKQTFFNKNTIVEMTAHYAVNIEPYLKEKLKNKRSVYIKHPKIRICMEPETPNAVTVTELMASVRQCCSLINKSRNNKELYANMLTFMKKCPMDINIPKSDAWKNAFMSNGIYHTMNNLIKFHDMHVYENTMPISADRSVTFMANTVTRNMKEKNYQKSYVMLLKFLSDNDVKQKLHDMTLNFDQIDA
jgi:hypothetical protein